MGLAVYAINFYRVAVERFKHVWLHSVDYAFDCLNCDFGSLAEVNKVNCLESIFLFKDRIVKTAESENLSGLSFNEYFDDLFAIDIKIADKKICAIGIHGINYRCIFVALELNFKSLFDFEQAGHALFRDATAWAVVANRGVAGVDLSVKGTQICTERFLS